jgi:ABC-type uncharacterized transport system substrate-binding protein
MGATGERDAYPTSHHPISQREIALLSWSSGDTTETRTLARELVELKPELIVGMTTPAVAALVKR